MTSFLFNTLKDAKSQSEDRAKVTKKGQPPCLAFGLQEDIAPTAHGQQVAIDLSKGIAFTKGKECLVLKPV